MRTLAIAVCLALAAGCVQPARFESAPPRGVPRDAPPPTIRQASHTEPPPKSDAEPPTGVDEFVQLAVGRNPRLAKASFAIDAAHGRRHQAGLYPNPTVAVSGDELGDRAGPSGIITAPQVSQEIVTGRKLSLSQAVVAAEVDQAAIGLYAERYAVVGGVRAAFYDLYALERSLAVHDELVRVAGEAVKNGQVLLKNQQIARLDLIQLELEQERFRAKAEAARKELPGARAKLAAATGDPRLPVRAATGPFDEVPLYDPDRTLDAVLASHPEVRAAHAGVARARAAVARAEAEPTPNVTVQTGYTRQNQNQSNDWLVGAIVPVPVWNRNQGNIRAAKAELGAAVADVERVKNALAERVAVALRAHASALREAELYRTELIPRGDEAYKLSLAAFKDGQFEFLRVIQAQRGIAEARLEYTRALGDAWKAAAELSALLLEEWWPGPPPTHR